MENSAMKLAALWNGPDARWRSGHDDVSIFQAQETSKFFENDIRWVQHLRWTASLPQFITDMKLHH